MESDAETLSQTLELGILLKDGEERLKDPEGQGCHKKATESPKLGLSGFIDN